MGLYINPKNKSKEEWLIEHLLVEKGVPPTIHTLKSNNLHTVVVCWMDNGQFTAAAVMYSAEELARFSDPADPRGKLWFIVPVSAVEAELGQPHSEWLK